MSRKISREELRRILGSKGGAAPPPDKRPKQFARAKPTVVNGFRFASKTEATLYRSLLLRQRSTPGSILLRQVRFDLPALAAPVEDIDKPDTAKPETWTPDFLFIEPAGDPPVWAIEVHEAKGTKGSESRDFTLRLRAFRLSFPNIPVTIWRTAGRGKIAAHTD